MRTKSKPPSHSVVIVRLISLSYSRWIISSKCGVDAIPVIVSGQRLGSEQIRDDRLRVVLPGDFQINRLLPGLDNDPERQERAAPALQVDETRALG